MKNVVFWVSFAPTSIALGHLLIQSTHLIYCRPLSLCIISSLEKRFEYLFNLSAPKSYDFIIASMNHPKFKSSWIPVRYMDLCRQLFINEYKIMNSKYNLIEPDVSSDNSSDSNSDMEFYSSVCSPNNSLIGELSNSSNSDFTLKNSNVTSVQALSFLNQKKKWNLMSWTHSQ